MYGFGLFGHGRAGEGKRKNERQVEICGVVKKSMEVTSVEFLSQPLSLSTSSCYLCPSPCDLSFWWVYICKKTSCDRVALTCLYYSDNNTSMVTNDATMMNHGDDGLNRSPHHKKRQTNFPHFSSFFFTNH